MFYNDGRMHDLIFLSLYKNKLLKLLIPISSVHFIFQGFFFGSRLLSSSFSLSSRTSSLSRSFGQATSAAGKNGAGRDHGHSFAAITVLLRAAAAAAASAPPGLLRLTCTGRRRRYWDGLLAGEAHIHHWFFERFNNVLRAQETSHTSNLSPSLSSFSSSCCCCFPSSAFGWGRSWTFVLTVLSVLAVLSVFSLHAGDGSSESLAADRQLLLLRHPEECVDPQLGL